jgi:hypothetical protein
LSLKFTGEFSLKRFLEDKYDYWLETRRPKTSSIIVSFQSTWDYHLTSFRLALYVVYDVMLVIDVEL